MKLHVGGQEKHPDWAIFDIAPGDIVDFVGTCTNMSQFDDNSVEEIYASHVLEHLSHQNEIIETLREFNRILQPGGRIFISVPDFMEHARVFTAPDLTTADRLKISRLIFGGQRNEYDIHKFGYSYDILEQLLIAVGFHQIVRVAYFNMFKDASMGKVDPVREDGSVCQSIDNMRFSINLVAAKPAAAPQVANAP